MPRSLFLLVWLAGALPAQGGIEDFAHWVGSYERESKNGRRSREQWVADGGLLRGSSSVLGPDGQWVVGERMLLVEIGPKTFYIAHPSQNPYPTAFELVGVEDGEAVFENREHDFPQRIGYRVDEQGIHAWIAGADEQRIAFEFERMDD